MNKLALSILLSSMPFFAADETLPKADTVLDHYVEVIGGKAVLEKHRNEVIDVVSERFQSEALELVAHRHDEPQLLVH